MDGEPLALGASRLLVEESDDAPIDPDVQGSGRIIEGDVGADQGLEIERTRPCDMSIIRYYAIVYHRRYVAIVFRRDRKEGRTAPNVQEAYLPIK